MKYGVQLPNLGPFSDVHLLLQLAQDAEQAGWDGFFLWDHVAIPERMADSMTVLGALAVTTQRMKLGVMVTGPSRRRPWKLARELTTLDHLSNGRIILGVGLGASDYDYDHVHEESDLKTRAARMDEALELMNLLWQGNEVTYSGQHFQVDALHFLPTPVQQPRIPIWVAGTYPNKAPFRRAARWDGVFALHTDGTLSPDDWQAINTLLDLPNEKLPHYECVHSGITKDEHDTAAVEPYAAVGVTWWLEDISPVRIGWPLGDPWPEPWDVPAITARIRQGPVK
jgi:alkanesulfonate monooxygenase SsuD/methylene tetrahydromethanopterin reductase-like flavin-dependent oxidoreductase (luciferase family)